MERAAGGGKSEAMLNQEPHFSEKVGRGRSGGGDKGERNKAPLGAVG